MRAGKIEVNSSIIGLMNHIIYLNIVVSLAAGVLAMGVAEYHGVEMSKWIGLFGYLATFTVYNGQRLIKTKFMTLTPWLSWVHKNRSWIIALVIFHAAFAMYVLLTRLSLSAEHMALLFIVAMISVLYVIRIGTQNLRDIPHLKIHLIAVSWSIMLVVFPMLFADVTLHKVFIWFLAHYFFVLGITIPFDIRDLKYDQIHQRTIPQVYGVSRARIIAVLAILLFSVMLLCLEQTLWYNLIFYTAVLTQILLIILMHKERGDLYCAGAIDGAIAVLGLAYFISA